jgi:Tol biopolymer transport system component
MTIQTKVAIGLVALALLTTGAKPSLARSQDAASALVQPGAPNQEHVAGTNPIILEKIGFSTDRDGNYEIYTMYADGTFPRNITNHPAGDYSPTWSLDGAQLAFATSRNYTTTFISDVYIMSSDGLSPTLLLPRALSPDWSPQVIQLALTTRNCQHCPGEITVIDADGLNATQVTSNTVIDDSPSWSPDGLQLVFTSYRDGNFEIYKMKASGLLPTRLTNNSASDLGAAWSPDGMTIVFSSSRDGNEEIYAMNADGSGVTRLTNNSATDYSPAWCPDRPKIAFVSNRDGNAEIYMMNADGSEQTRLTDNPADDTDPTCGRISLHSSVTLPVLLR